MIKGANLVGGNAIRPREEDDFYATDPRAVELLLDHEEFELSDVLEPSVGQGHIARVIESRNPNARITAVDIVDRGYPNTIVADFTLPFKVWGEYDSIILNPPYKYAEEFIRKCIGLLKPNGKMACFLKIQFLESSGRKVLFDKYPPKYVYVFRERMATWRNGRELDENNKPWSNTVCFAWFVWYKGFEGEPILRWI